MGGEGRTAEQLLDALRHWLGENRLLHEPRWRTLTLALSRGKEGPKGSDGMPLSKRPSTAPAGKPTYNQRGISAVCESDPGQWYAAKAFAENAVRKSFLV